MLFRIQTDLQSVFYLLAHSIVDVKRVDNHQHTCKRPIFEILCNSDPFEIDLDALRKSDGLLLHFDGEKYPNGWIFKDSCALVNNESEGGVHTSSMGDIYPIIPFRRGDSDYYQYGDYEIKAEYTSPHHLHEIRNLLRSGNIKAAENYFLAQFWKKVR